MIIERRTDITDIKVLLTVLLCCTLLFFTSLTSQSFFVYLYILFGLFFIGFFSIDEASLFLIGLVGCSRLIIFNPTYPINYFWLLTTAFIIKCLYKRIKISKNSFILGVLTYLYMLMGLVPGEPGFLSDVKTILNYCYLLIIVYRFNKKNWIKFFDFYIIGHLISIILYYPVSQSSFFTVLLQEAFTNTSVINVYRFTGLDADTNYFAANCSFIIASLLFFLSNNLKFEVSNFKIRIFLCIYLLLGTLSFSKTFFIALVCLVLLYVTSNVVRDFRNLVSVALIMVAGIYLLDFVTNGLIQRIFNDVILARFIERNSDLNSLTTGRFFIWQVYIDHWLSSAYNILFGLGMGHKFLPSFKMQHQTFLEILYQFGVIGTLLFGSFVYSLYRHIYNGEAVKKDININYLGLFSIFIFSCSINQFSFDYFMFHIFLSMLLLRGGYELH